MRVSLWMYMFYGSKVSSLTQSFFCFSFWQRAWFSLTSGFTGGISYEIILNWQLTTCIKNYSRHLSFLHRKDLFLFVCCIFLFFYEVCHFWSLRVLLCDCEMRRVLIKIITHKDICKCKHRHCEHGKARNHLIKQ